MVDANCYKVVDGYIPGGNDLRIEKMTVAAAKLEAMRIEGCRGFCHVGAPTNEAVTIFFKSVADTDRNTERWTTYVLPQPVQTPQGFLPVGTEVQYLSQTQGSWVLAVVVGYGPGCYILERGSGSAIMRHQAEPGRVKLRVGSEVDYYSEATGGWIPATLLGVDVQQNGYILDIRPQAPPAKVRPRKFHGAERRRRSSAQMCYFVGSEAVWASDFASALAKAAKQAECGHQLVGFPKVKLVKDLSESMQEYYKTLSVAVNSGGEKVLNQIAMKSFRDFDKDGNEKLSLEELHNLCGHITTKLTLPQMDPMIVRDIFVRYDRNHSGYIEMSEFPELFRRLLRRVLAGMKVAGQRSLLRESKQQFEKKYELGKKIASGAGGTTYIATDRSSGMQVVIKKPKHVTDTSDFEKVRHLSHPNIVRVFELYTSPFETFVVMEFCLGGDLFNCLKHCHEKLGGVSMKFITTVMKEVMNGIQYIHQEFKECHNDIKPENVLLDRKPATCEDAPRAMIADFGCASGLGAGCTGDPRYNAPELWASPPASISYATDVWALGVMVYEMLSGGLLIFTDHQNISGWQAWYSYNELELFKKMQDAIVQPGAQPDWDPIAHSGPLAVELCQQMLAWTPSDRIDLARALESPWLRAYDEDTSPSLPDNVAKALDRRAEMSAMKMLLLNLVATRLQGEHIQHYRCMWKAADKDGSGTLQEDEFVEMLVRHSMSLEQAKDLFGLADIDVSGSVSFNEFVAVMFNPDAMSNADLEKHLVLIFNGLSDANGLTLQSFLDAFPDEASRNLLTKLFSHIDADGNGRIALDEFFAFVSAM